MPTPPLLGTYTPPRVRRGDLVTCLYRDADCVVTTMHDGRIPWPRCRRVGGHGAGSGLLVTEELARAIRTESAAAIMHWFGVGTKAVWKWRRALLDGEGKFRTPGSRAAHKKASKAGAKAIKAREWSAEERAAMSATAKAEGRKAPKRWTPRNGGWKAKELALLRGKLTDAEVAVRIGRTEAAVRSKRQRVERTA